MAYIVYNCEKCESADETKSKIMFLEVTST